MSLTEITPVKKYTLEQFTFLLKRLLPVGALWNSINETFWDLLESFAVELNRADQRIVDLQTESIPGLSTDDGLLTDWETLALLTDEKVGASEAERQSIVHTKIFNPTPTPNNASRRQGPTEEFFTNYAAGLNITITSFGTHDLFRVGANRVGDRMYTAAGIAFIWIVNYTGGTSTERAAMKAYFERMKPSHTEVEFNPTI